jgi:hypothetical protein
MASRDAARFDVRGSVRQNLARATAIAVWPRCVARRHLPAGRCPSGVDPISDTATATFPDPPVPPTRDTPATATRLGHSRDAAPDPCPRSSRRCRADGEFRPRPSGASRKSAHARRGVVAAGKARCRGGIRSDTPRHCVRSCGGRTLSRAEPLRHASPRASSRPRGLCNWGYSIAPQSGACGPVPFEVSEDCLQGGGCGI